MKLPTRVITADTHAVRTETPLRRMQVFDQLRTAFGRYGRWPLVLLIIVLVAAAELRFYKLERKSLWSDELYTAVLALYRDASIGQQIERFRRISMTEVIDADTFWTVKASDQSPPLFDLIAKASVKLFKPIERGVRLPSVAFSVALLLFLAWSALAGARETRAARVMLIVLILTAFSATAIEYAQEGRPYSLGLLCAGILSAQFYLRLERGLRDAPLPRWPEVAVFIAGCYTHYNMIIFSAPLLLLYGGIALYRKDGWSLSRLALVPVAFLPWAYLAEHTITHTLDGGVAWYPRATPWQAVVDSFAIQQVVLGTGFILIASVLVFVQLTLWLVSRRHDVAHAAGTVAWLIGVATLYLLLISQLRLSAGMFDARYFVFSLPLFLFAAATAIVSVFGRHWLGLVTALLLALTQAQAIRANQLRMKEPYREAVRWLGDRIDRGGLVLTTWNKNYYRVYFDGSEKAPELLNFTQEAEVPPICRQIEPLPSVAVIAFNTHGNLLQALITGCGPRYTIHEQRFGPLIAQHWVR